MLSTSVAVTVPIAVWFSATLKVADEVITGASSSRLLMFTVIFWERDPVMLVAVTIAE